MLDFFKDKTKRKAFKQALKEVEQETASISHAKQTKDTSITRTYQSEAKVEEVHGVYKIKSPLKKPETTAIDLKNFKDWRKVETVESKQPKYVGSPRPTVLKQPDEDDIDFTEHKKTIPGGEFKKPEPEVEPSQGEQVSTLDLADSIYAKQEAKKKDLSSASYAKEQADQSFKRKSLREMMSVVSPDTVAKYDAKKEEEKRLTEKKLIEEQQKKQAETRIKVEVVDFEKKPAKVEAPKPVVKPEPKVEPKPAVKVEPAPQPKVEEAPKPAPKKTVNRKPRGKSKKRYDADVISSVNWRKTKK